MADEVKETSVGALEVARLATANAVADEYYRRVLWPRKCRRMKGYRRTVPVIAVGDLTAYESKEQAAKACRVSEATMRRAIRDGNLVRGRPWMRATVQLLAVIAVGGWHLAKVNLMVPPHAEFACSLGRLNLRKLYTVRVQKTGAWAGAMPRAA